MRSCLNVVSRVYAYTLLTFSLFLVGCGQLVPDPASPAFESNYPSAEFSACGNTHLGQAVCSIEEGKPYNEIGFKIQGYYDGVIKIASPDCELDGPEVFSYSESQLIPIKIKGNADKSCFIEFVIEPEYPTQNQNPIDIYNFKGLLYIKKIPMGSEFLSESMKVRRLKDRKLILNIGGQDDKARLVFTGCGTNYDTVVDVVSGLVNIRLNNLLTTNMVGNCIINGALITGDRKIRISYLLSIYAEEFNIVPIPVTKVVKKKIEVNFTTTVSIVSVNNKYKMKHKGKFKFNKNSINIVRGITVKGRSVIGIWNPQAQQFHWKK